MKSGVIPHFNLNTPRKRKKPMKEGGSEFTPSSKQRKATRVESFKSSAKLLDFSESSPLLAVEVEGLEVKTLKVAVGSTFVAALLEDGRAYVLPSEPLEVPRKFGKVVDLDCGYEHGIVLTSAGQVLTWGTALRGQLGNDTVDCSPQPAEVQALAGINCVAIAAGGWQSCAVSSDGDLYTWGWNKFGQLGAPRTLDNLETGVSVAYIPIVVDWPEANLPPVVSVSCGSSHMIALLGNGELWGCGWNKYGQLGLGDVETVHTMTRIPVRTDILVKKVVCGSWNSAVICGNGAAGKEPQDA